MCAAVFDNHRGATRRIGTSTHLPGACTKGCGFARRIDSPENGRRFGVDVASGDPVFGEADVVTADDVLDFAGIAPPVLRLYPIETHIAEKLHAYTMPRTRTNTRVKDLPDLALLAGLRPMQAGRLRAALADLHASSDASTTRSFARSTCDLVHSVPRDGAGK
jgi:hypothetical protein